MDKLKYSYASTPYAVIGVNGGFFFVGLSPRSPRLRGELYGCPTIGDYYFMRHSLVTGGAGFIGSHLVEALLARGDRVVGGRRRIDRLGRQPGRRAGTIRGCSYTKGTVADEELVGRLVADVDEVYHLAAAVGVQLIAQSPIRTIETNIYTTELLLRQLGRLLDARPAGEVLPGQHAARSTARTPSRSGPRRTTWCSGPTTRSRWSYGAIEGDRRVPGAGLLARAAAAGGHRPVVQRRRAAADGRLRHGAAAAGRRRPGRRPAGGPRRRPAAAVLRPRRRRGAA